MVRRRPWLGLLTVVAVVMAMSAIGLWSGFLSSYRAIATDALFPRGETDDRIVVVGVDQVSLAAVGERWPWSRATQAELINAIAAAGPAAVVVDVVYDPSAPGDAELSAALSDASAIVASLAEVSPGGDRLLAALITPPVETVARGLGVGHAAVTLDVEDGVARSLPLLLEDRDGTFAPALSLFALARLERLPLEFILRPSGVQVGSRHLPTDRRGQLRISYSAALSGKAADRAIVSASDVLAGSVPRERLAGKVVFVGATEPSLGDWRATPPDKGGMAGVFVHANALNTMLTRGFLSTSGHGETLVAVAALVMLAGLVSFRLRLRWAAPIVGAAVAAYVLFAFVRFESGMEMDLIYPPLAAVACAVGVLGLRYLLAGREQRRMARLLEQYVPSPVARRLIDSGRRRGMPPTGMITFLFTDVVDSTRAWDEYPTEMSEAMRRHDVLVETAVEAEGGALVRPRGEGDSRFGVFLVPADGARAALAVDVAITAERWKTPSPVQVRMGLHTGEAELREGDYYGSSVNRCARIRGIAEPGEIILSSTTAELVKADLPVGSLIDRGMHELKGLREPEHAFALVAVDYPSP